MNQTSNLVITLIFAALGVWMMIGWLKTRKQITIKDKRWNMSRILFTVAGLLSLVTMVFGTSIFDIIRTIATVFCIVMFVLQRDGIGENGIVSIGQGASWQDIKAYDVHDMGKKALGIFIVEDNKGKKPSEYTMQITFDAKDSPKVKAYLKEKIGRKYRRMKR